SVPDSSPTSNSYCVITSNRAARMPPGSLARDHCGGSDLRTRQQTIEPEYRVGRECLLVVGIRRFPPGKQLAPALMGGDRPHQAQRCQRRLDVAHGPLLRATLEV